jgi:hypothetical protein
MPEQNFKNHVRMVPLFHYVASLAILIPFVISVIHFFKAVLEKSGRVNAGAMVLLIVGIILVFWFSRVFALKAQDRAIRAEENFRHFVATGKPLDSRLRMGQIIALRFAGDNEFVALAKKAADENMAAKDIKLAVQNWRTDNYRA